jgi:predicted Fe-Mo cluster-binding NifX family protein
VKVAVSSTGAGLDAQIDPRFGRCQYFIVVDSDSMQFETVENPNVMAAGGAGIQAAQLVADKGAQVVLTGNCGPNAFQTLQAAGIAVCVGVAGTVGQAVERYKKGEFQPVSAPNVADKFGVGGGGGVGGGMGGGRGRGMGRGGGGSMGRGMGYGMGMGGGRGGGMGRCMGMGGGMWAAGIGGGWPVGRFSETHGAGDELAMLRTQAEALMGQLEMIRKRIEDLEKGSEG